MKFISLIKNRWFVAYYMLILMVIFIILLNPNAQIPLIQRTLFSGLILIPVFFELKILPAVLLLFLGINSQSFATIFLPYNLYIPIVTLFYYILYNNKSSNVVKEIIILVIFFSIALLHIDINNCFVWIFLTILLSDMVNNKDDLKLLFCAFIILSFFLSLLYLILWKDLAVQYYSTDIEYANWTNHNVFGAVIAAGSSLASAYTIGILKFEKTLSFTILSVATMIISFFALTLNGSRGAFLAFTLSTIYMVTISQTKLFFKLIIILLGTAVVVWIFKNNFFDLLIYRMEIDETKTGGRSIIWGTKLNLFMMSENPLQFILGIGQTACNNLGWHISTHNDFMTALIAYGFIGFCIFIYCVFIYPIKMAGNNKLVVSAMLMYLFIECCVLEPIFRGYFVEIMFYFFVMKYAIIIDKETNNSSLKNNILA